MLIRQFIILFKFNKHLKILFYFKINFIVKKHLKSQQNQTPKR